MLLAPTSYSTAESAAPGEGRGGGIGGGAPLRYDYTAPGYCTISPWVNSSCTYSLLQLNLGSNPLSKLEVVSLLNIPSQGHAMYHYNSANRTQKYNPKVYLSTLQSVALQWNRDYQQGITLQIGRAHV